METLERTLEDFSAFLRQLVLLTLHFISNEAEEVEFLHLLRPAVNSCQLEGSSHLRETQLRYLVLKEVAKDELEVLRGQVSLSQQVQQPQCVLEITS